MFDPDSLIDVPHTLSEAEEEEKHHEFVVQSDKKRLGSHG